MSAAARPLRLVPREEPVREPKPEAVNARPHEWAITEITVVNTVTGERREIDPRAWPDQGKRS